jgi:hypothetical protein
MLFSLRALLASPLDDKKPVYSLRRSITPTLELSSSREIVALSTPSNTDRNSDSGRFSKSDLALFPNRISEAATAVFRSSSEWTPLQGLFEEFLREDFQYAQLQEILFRSCF